MLDSSELSSSPMLDLSQYSGYRVLVVDDSETDVMLLRRALSGAGIADVADVQDPRAAAGACRRLQPDLVLLDLRMAPIGGLEVLRRLRDEGLLSRMLPVLVLTGDLSPESKRSALEAGAMDFINKSLDPTELLLRVRNMLEMRRLYLELQDRNEDLERRVRDRTKELEESRREILVRLALAAEYRDDATGEHTRRVGNLSALIADSMGLSPEFVGTIRQAALVHDIGKIAIPDALLAKPGGLDQEERNQMKAHTIVGGRILSGSTGCLLHMAEQIAMHHHEHWDGSGYPRGLRGPEISLAGRIVALADVFDALVTERPYKEAWPVDMAVAEIHSRRGLHFDPDVVDAFGKVAAAHGLPVSDRLEDEFDRSSPKGLAKSRLH